LVSSLIALVLVAVFKAARQCRALYALAGVHKLKGDVVFIKVAEVSIAARNYPSLPHYRYPGLTEVAPHEDVTLRDYHVTAICAVVICDVVPREV
jgi:hypothetical protein